MFVGVLFVYVLGCWGVCLLLVCFVLFCFVLFCFVLFVFVFVITFHGQPLFVYCIVLSKKVNYKIGFETLHGGRTIKWGLR